MIEATENDRSDDKLAAYRFFIDPGVNSFEELAKFKVDFPDCSDTLIIATFARLAYEKDGRRFFGF